MICNFVFWCTLSFSLSPSAPSLSSLLPSLSLSASTTLFFFFLFALFYSVFSPVLQRKRRRHTTGWVGRRRIWEMKRGIPWSEYIELKQSIFNKTRASFRRLRAWTTKDRMMKNLPRPWWVSLSYFQPLSSCSDVSMKPRTTRLSELLNSGSHAGTRRQTKTDSYVHWENGSPQLHGNNRSLTLRALLDLPLHVFLPLTACLHHFKHSFFFIAL